MNILSVDKEKYLLIRMVPRDKFAETLERNFFFMRKDRYILIRTVRRVNGVKGFPLG